MGAAAAFIAGLNAVGAGSIDLDTSDLRMHICKNDTGLAVTGATNATPIVITSTSHGLSTGHRVLIRSVAGNTAANGVWTVTVVDANTFSLQNTITGANIAGNGSYTSGGRVIPLTLWDNLDDVVSGQRIGTAVALSGRSMSAGVFTASDVTFSSVTSGSTVGFAVIYLHTGTESTSTLLWVSSVTDTATNGGNITIGLNNDTTNRVLRFIPVNV